MLDIKKTALSVGCFVGVIYTLIGLGFAFFGNAFWRFIMKIHPFNFNVTLNFSWSGVNLQEKFGRGGEHVEKDDVRVGSQLLRDYSKPTRFAVDLNNVGRTDVLHSRNANHSGFQ